LEVGAQEEIQAYVLARFEGSGSRLCKELRGQEFGQQITFVDVTFGRFDLFLIIRTTSLKSLQNLVTNYLCTREDVTETVTLIPFEFRMERLEDEICRKNIAILLGNAKSPNFGIIMSRLKEMQKNGEIIMAQDILGPYDFIVFIELKSSLHELGIFISNKIRTIPGVENTMTLLTCGSGLSEQNG
jgi:hypothetical protein